MGKNRVETMFEMARVLKVFTISSDLILVKGEKVHSKTRHKAMLKRTTKMAIVDL